MYFCQTKKCIYEIMKKKNMYTGNTFQVFWSTDWLRCVLTQDSLMNVPFWFHVIVCEKQNTWPTCSNKHDALSGWNKVSLDLSFALLYMQSKWHCNCTQFTWRDFQVTYFLVFMCTGFHRFSCFRYNAKIAVQILKFCYFW